MNMTAKLNYFCYISYAKLLLQVDNYQYVIPKIQLLHKLNADGEIDVIDEAIAMTFTTTHILSRSRNPGTYLTSV